MYLCRKEQWKESQKILEEIVAEFADVNHPLTKVLKEETPYPFLYERSEFALAESYMKLSMAGKAQERLGAMLEHYRERGVKEGLYLSHTWRELGKLAFQCKDYETALNCLKIAESVGKNYLSAEQKLKINLMISECYRYQKEYDTAMRLLSNVINADIASPLRLKAMYLRAEIYELQDRHELAIRQLEATAKYGGEWGILAKDKLRREYGLE
ncbi:MAG: tetratricopeptide repeat protein [Chlamydiales bacterium]